VSATNEPQWDWSDGGQEGTPFENEHIAGINKALSKKLLRQITYRNFYCRSWSAQLSI
jgi:hypothetical protein